MFFLSLFFCSPQILPIDHQPWYVPFSFKATCLFTLIYSYWTLLRVFITLICSSSRTFTTITCCLEFVLVSLGSAHSNLSKSAFNTYPIRFSKFLMVAPWTYKVLFVLCINLVTWSLTKIYFQYAEKPDGTIYCGAFWVPWLLLHWKLGVITLTWE